MQSWDQSTQNHCGSDHNDLTATVDGQFSGNIPKNSFSGWWISLNYYYYYSLWFSLPQDCLQKWSNLGIIFQANRYLLSTFWCPSMLGHNRFRHRHPFYLPGLWCAGHRGMAEQHLQPRATFQGKTDLVFIWVYSGKSYGWFMGTPIYGNLHMFLCIWIQAHPRAADFHRFRVQKPTVPTLENSRKSHRSSVRLEVGT